jgi:hypothetical protein
MSVPLVIFGHGSTSRAIPSDVISAQPHDLSTTMAWHGMVSALFTGRAHGPPE